MEDQIIKLDKIAESVRFSTVGECLLILQRLQNEQPSKADVLETAMIRLLELMK